MKVTESMRRFSIVVILSNTGEHEDEFLARLEEFFATLMPPFDSAVIAYSATVETVENRYGVAYLVDATKVRWIEDACLRAGLDFLPATEEFEETEVPTGYDWIYVEPT